MKHLYYGVEIYGERAFITRQSWSRGLFSVRSTCALTNGNGYGYEADTVEELLNGLPKIKAVSVRVFTNRKDLFKWLSEGIKLNDK